MSTLPADILALLAPLERVPGYSPRQLPAASEKLLQEARPVLGDDAAFDLWVGVLFAQVYQAPDLAATAAQLAGTIGQAGQLLHRRNEAPAAQAVQRHLPNWVRALEATVAALPAPELTPPTALPEPDQPESAPVQLLDALYRLYLDAHWMLYCHLPDKGRAVANALADLLPAVLRRNGLGWNNSADYLLQEANDSHQRLARLVAEAQAGPYPAAARDQVLHWAHEALHKEKPTGLKTFAKTVARAAQTWTDAAFDQFLRAVVLYETEWDDAQNRSVRRPADALKFRRQSDRRALPEALHALGRSTPEAARLAAWLTEVQQPAPAAPPAPLPADAVLIPDAALRLAIIHELMYVQQRIRPAFEVREFAKTYPLREIDVEQEGYQIIPEALAYFAELPLTPALLDHVTTLDFEFGKPPMDIMFQVFPFDDGEGDELQLLDLSGLEHCRNLEHFALIELWPDYTPPSLAPLLQLPKLRKAQLDPVLQPDPAYQELARQGRLEPGA